MKQQRAKIKGQLTRIANTINETTSIAEAKVKLKKMAETWVAFDDNTGQQSFYPKSVTDKIKQYIYKVQIIRKVAALWLSFGYGENAG